MGSFNLPPGKPIQFYQLVRKQHGSVNLDILPKTAWSAWDDADYPRQSKKQEEL